MGVALNWPFVSRARFEDLQQRLDESEAERKEVWSRLFAMAEQAATEPAPAVPTAEPGVSQESFTTPFDRIERNFDKANRGKNIPAKFKARAR
jgi:hypothetical protein